MSIVAQLGTIAASRRRVLGLIVLVAITVVASRGWACSRALFAIEASYPIAHQVDVATNVVLFAYGESLEAARLSLRTAAGREVPISVQASDGPGFDITPVHELEPETDYVLDARPASLVSASSIPFRAGMGPVEPVAEDTLAGLVLTQRTALVGNCGTLASICASIPPTAHVFLELRVGDEVLGFTPPARFTRASSLPLRADECVSARVRDVHGRRSKPLTLCDKDIAGVPLERGEDLICPAPSPPDSASDHDAASEASQTTALSDRNVPLGASRSTAGPTSGCQLGARGGATALDFAVIWCALGLGVLRYRSKCRVGADR